MKNTISDNVFKKASSEKFKSEKRPKMMLLFLGFVGRYLYHYTLSRPQQEFRIPGRLSISNTKEGASRVPNIPGFT